MIGIRFGNIASTITAINMLGFHHGLVIIDYSYSEYKIGSGWNYDCYDVLNYYSGDF